MTINSQYESRNPFANLSGYFVSGKYNGRGIHDEILEGMVLGKRFTIQERLGNGAYSSVHAAQDNVRGETVALKVVELGHNAPDEALQMVRGEMKASTRIADFRHIIRVYDVHLAQFGGSTLLLISMELADGGDLRKWLLTNAGNWELRKTQGRDLCIQACEGVAALHLAGTLHLDLKPENLLLVNGGLKVGDLGSASAIRQARLATGILSHRTSSPPGTPVYMAPERFSSSCTDALAPQADIYSLGVIMFELLGERCCPPFNGPDEQLAQLHRTAPLPPLEGVAGPMARAISRCLEKAPSRRYAFVSEILEDIRGESAGNDAATGDQAGTDPIAAQMQMASNLYAEGDLNNARSVCQRILDATPAHTEAARMLAYIQSRSDLALRYYAQARNELGRRRLKDILSLVWKAAEIYPGHPDGPLVQEDLRLRINEHMECIQGAKRSLATANLQEALLYLSRSQEISPGSIRVADTIRKLRQAIGEYSHPRQHEAPQRGRR